MADTIKQKAFDGVIWNALDAIVSKGVTFIFNVLIARCLLPSDYGAVAMLGIFLALAQTFVDSGFGNALIRNPERTEDDFNTVFIFNLLVSVLVYILLWFSAPLIASFYDIPLLSSILRVISLTLIINAICNNQWIQLTIAINFKTKAIISISSVFISGVIGLYCAMNGYGVWTLVIQSLVSAVVKCALLWILIRWIPNWKFSVESFKKLFAFGSKLLMSSLLGTLYSNIHSLVIGKVYDAGSLGYYSRARSFAELPSTFITTTLQNVSFPVFSSIQNDHERLRSYYSKFICLLAFIVFPLMLGLVAIAEPLVRCLLTDVWIGCVPYLRLLSIALVTYPICCINLNVLIVSGRSDYILKLEVMRRVIGIVLLVVTIPFGLAAICMGQIIVYLCDWLLVATYADRVIQISFLDQIKSIKNVMILSTLMAALVYLITLSISNSWIQLFVGLTVGCVFYIGSAYFFKFSELIEIIDLVKNKLTSIIHKG